MVHPPPNPAGSSGVIGIVLLNFTLLHLAPGDPAMVYIGEAGGASEETLKEIRREFGLDKSLAE